MRHDTFLLMLVASFVSGACDDAENRVALASTAEEVSGLRLSDVTCGNFATQGMMLAFASQSLDEGVFEVLLEMDATTLGWMGDSVLGIQSLDFDDGTSVTDLNQEALRDLRRALDDWFADSPQTVFLHEELLLEVIDQMLAGDEAEERITVWSLQ